MKCEDLLRALNDHVDGAIDAETRASFERHMAGCDPCRVVVDNIERTITLYRGEDVFELPPDWRAGCTPGCASGGARSRGSAEPARSRGASAGSSPPEAAPSPRLSPPALRHEPCGFARPEEARPAMFFKRIKTPGIAHNAYLFAEDGRGVLVDPRRDVDEYLALARENELAIELVLETHRQEDFLFGSATIAEKTGAKIVTGDHRLFGTSDIRLGDGEELSLGKLRIRALHTPGHTPESTSYVLFLEDTGEVPWGIFTGDALFIGDAGRTDLSDPAKTAENAGVLFDVLREKVLPLGDQTLLFPAHGSGSVCGGNLADRDDSTVGLERRTNPAFTLSREAFVAAKVRERLPRPPYFKISERANLKGGRPLAKRLEDLAVLAPEPFRTESKQGLVIDTRDPEAFAGGHLPGSLNVWLDGIPVFGGWVAQEGTPLYLVLDREEDLDAASRSLARIGIDGLKGYLAGGFEAWRDAGLPVAYVGTLSPAEVSRNLERYLVVDVREVSEFEDEGHIAGARHIYVGDLDRRARELRSFKEAPIVVTCSVGHRAGLAASVLARHGFTNVSNLLGGMTAWQKLGLPTVKEEEDASAPAANAASEGVAA